MCTYVDKCDTHMDRGYFISFNSQWGDCSFASIVYCDDATFALRLLVIEIDVCLARVEAQIILYYFSVRTISVSGILISRNNQCHIR